MSTTPMATEARLPPFRTRWLNTHSGSTGSAARRSTRTNATRVAAPLDLLVEVGPQHPGREAAQRDVDEEDPAPAEVLREDPAQGRADDRRGTPHAGDV